MKKQVVLSRPSMSVKAAAACLALFQCLYFAPPQAGIANEAYAAAVDRPVYKSTWLWNVSSLQKNKDSWLQFFRQNGVNLVFLQIDPDTPNTDYSNFIQAASALGIAVHALGGAPDWVLRDNQIKMYKLIDWVKNYNSTVAADAQFKGIHLDVEPFVLPQWYADTDTMLGLWRDTVTGFVEEMRFETPALTAGADLPVWLGKYQVPDGHGGRTTLSNWMIRELDQATMMAYRDNAADIISSVAPEMNEAERVGKPIIVAVETVHSSEGAISFYDKGRRRMIEELGMVTETFKNRVPYAGYAVHDFLGWSGLRE